MVPGAGLEPARPFERGILNPLCLPISPPGLIKTCLRDALFVNLICKPYFLSHFSAPPPDNPECGRQRTHAQESGGASRSRTEVGGFAIRSMATLPTRPFFSFKSFALLADFYKKRVLTSHLSPNKPRSRPFISFSERKSEQR